MDPFECYTFEYIINNKIGFKRFQPQGYAKSPHNIKSQGNLVVKHNQESKKGPSQTAKIAEPLQGVKPSMKSVMTRVIKEAILEDEMDD